MTMKAKLAPRDLNEKGHVSRGHIARSQEDSLGIDIASWADCDIQMAAVAAHTDEIMELLSVLPSRVGDLLFKSIVNMRNDLLCQLHDDEEEVVPDDYTADG